MGPVKAVKRKLKSAERDSLAAALSALLRRFVPGAVAAYLFGSCARGEDFSDLDVGLLMGHDVPQPLELELRLEVELEKHLKIPTDVRILDRAPLSFQFAVVRDGRLLVDTEPNRRAAFEGIVRKKYFDFAFFRKRYIKEAVDAGF